MSKIALVTDLHWGARNDNPKIIEFQSKFFREVFFPYIDEHKITDIVDLGDTFDRRKYINFVTLAHCQEEFFNPIQEREINLHALVGNHDSFYRNTLNINSMHLLARHYPNMKIYSEPTEVAFGNTSVVMLPWICKENETETYRLCRETKAQVVFSHLELAGYQMHQGHAIDHGMDDNWLQHFDLVCTGHYHTRSRHNNINYLGCPYEMTWADFDDQKGFHVFDTETRELTFIPNPNSIFHKVWYDDESNDYTVGDLDFSMYKDCYIKVIVKCKSNPFLFDMWIEALEKVGVIHVQVVEDHLNLDMEDDDAIVEEAEDTITILNKYVEHVSTDTDRAELSSLMRELYHEAISIL
tara:strand:- start:4865 stop:5926 length:1062 start_codon:yes stop_codon:yes gene_type:complete